MPMTLCRTHYYQTALPSSFQIVLTIIPSLNSQRWTTHPRAVCAFQTSVRIASPVAFIPDSTDYHTPGHHPLPSLPHLIPISFFFLKTGSCYVDQAIPELLLLPSLKYWDYRQRSHPQLPNIFWWRAVSPSYWRKTIVGASCGLMSQQLTLVFLPPGLAFSSGLEWLVLLNFENTYFHVFFLCRNCASSVPFLSALVGHLLPYSSGFWIDSIIWKEKFQYYSYLL